MNANDEPQDGRTTVGHTEAECTECRWTYLSEEAEALTQLADLEFGEAVDQQATAHELATDHKVVFEESESA